MVWPFIFKEIRSREKISQEQLGKILGVTRSAIGQIETGNNTPTVPMLFKLIKRFNLNANRIGPMLEANEDRLPGLLTGLFHTDTERTAEKIVPGNPPAGTSEDIVRVPVVEIDVAAGGGSYNADYLTEIDAVFIPRTLLKGKKKQVYLAVRVRGESMSPTLLDKGLLIIHPVEPAEWRNIHDGQVYVVIDREGRSYVKRLKNRFDRGYLLLASDNPDKLQYGDFTLDEEDIHAIWQADGYFTTYMPDIHEQYYHRLTDIEAELSQVKNQIARISRSMEKK